MDNLSNLTTMEAFHNINRIKPERILLTNTEIIFNDGTIHYPNGFVRYKNIMPGLQRVIFDDTTYVINVSETISGNDTLTIGNRSDIYTTIDNKIDHIIPYRLILDDYNGLKRAVANTVNCTMDGFIIAGNTTLSDIPYPNKDNVKLESTHDFYVTSRNPFTGGQIPLPIKLPNNIKSLPSGICDILVVDTFHKKAYILFKIGRMILSGGENYLEIYKSDSYTTFFMPLTDAIIGYGNDKNINCNYFPTVTYSDMINPYNKCGISTGINNETRGLFFKIPSSILPNASVLSFKKFLNDRFNKNSVIVEYAMSQTKYRSALLDEYCVNQYYPATELWTTNTGNKVGYLLRSIAKR